MSNETPSWKLVGMTIVLAGIYATITGVGIKVFERCDAIQSSEKWQNIKIEDTYVKIANEHRDCDFFSNWLKN